MCHIIKSCPANVLKAYRHCTELCDFSKNDTNKTCRKPNMKEVTQLVLYKQSYWRFNDDM